MKATYFFAGKSKLNLKQTLLQKKVLDASNFSIVRIDFILDVIHEKMAKRKSCFFENISENFDFIVSLLFYLLLFLLFVIVIVIVTFCTLEISNVV